MVKQVILWGIGMSAGMVVAGGMSAFLISLGILSRYAEITGTRNRVSLYEDMVVAGTTAGTFFSLYEGMFPAGIPVLAIFGLAAGIFLGGWVVALEEVVHIFPMLCQRTGIRKGMGLIILCMAAGKMCGSLFFFWKGW